MSMCGLHLPRSTEGRKEELIGWKGWKGRLGVLMGGECMGRAYRGRECWLLALLYEQCSSSSIGL